MRASELLTSRFFYFSLREQTRTLCDRYMCAHVFFTFSLRASLPFESSRATHNQDTQAFRLRRFRCSRLVRRSCWPTSATSAANRPIAH